MKSWMRAAVIACVMAFGGMTTASAAIGDNDAAQKMDDATSVLQQFVNIPENSIPQALLRQAYGIAVIPSVFKISFLGGVQRGKGVLSVRTEDGKWSDPTFITLTGGSVGFQAGVSSTDIILVFKTQRSVDRIANGQISLGGDASVAAGPVGRSVGASTNMDFNAEVYSYSRSRGLFGGVSLGGARIGIDKDANWLFYEKPGIKASTLLTRDTGSALPQSGQQFVYTLNQYMPPSADQFHYGANTGSRDNTAQPGTAGGYDTAGDQGSVSGQTRPYDSTHGQTSGSYGAPSGTGAQDGAMNPNGQSRGITVQQNSGTPINGTTGAPTSSNDSGSAAGTSDYTGDSADYGYDGSANNTNRSNDGGSGY